VEKVEVTLADFAGKLIALAFINTSGILQMFSFPLICDGMI
jgi:hypothetical protein